MRQGQKHPADRRQRDALPAADRRRLDDLTRAGSIDSFGLAVGWTIFNLWVVEHRSLTTVGLLNAAMLAGVALSAPAARTLAARWPARRVLRGTAGSEAALRVLSFGLLVSGAWTPLVAIVVFAMNVIAWSGFATMRAEVAAVDRRARALTRYAAAIGVAEAVGAVAAVVLAVGADNLDGGLLAAVVACYAASLVPTFLVADGARTGRSVDVPLVVGMSYVSPLLWTGAAVMVLASGPTMLAIGLAAEWHGTAAVAPVALAAAAGALLAPRLSIVLERSPLPVGVLWPAIGAAMIAGWAIAPFHVAGLVGAQLMSGLALATLEGSMDARVVHRAGAGQVTAALAAASSSRALGSAVSVALIPLALQSFDIAILAGLASVVLLGAALAASLWGDHSEPRLLPPDPPIRPLQRVG